MMARERMMLWVLALASISLCLLSQATAGPPITSLRFSPDGQKIVAGSQSGIEIRSWPELTLERKIATSLRNVHDIAFSPTGDRFAVSGGAPGESGAVEIYAWLISEQPTVCEPQPDSVYQSVWSANGTRIITAGWDGRCLVYDATTLQVTATYTEHSGPVLAIASVEPVMALSAGVDGTIRVWNTDTGKHVRTFDNHTKSVTAIAVRAGDTWKQTPWLASASDDNTVRFWQPTIGRMLRFTKLESTPVAIAWSSDNESIIVASTSGLVQAIDPQTLKAKKQIQTHHNHIFSLAVSAQNQGIAIGTTDGIYRVEFDD
jgi:WD40 repeat protein